MAQWNTTTKHQPSEINNGNEYGIDDNVSLEELNAIVENSFYAMGVADATVVKYTVVSTSNTGINITQ